MPVTLTLDEVEAQRPCSTCERLEYEGTVTIKVPADRASGTMPAKCTRGHLLMVEFTRSESSDDVSG